MHKPQQDVRILHREVFGQASSPAVPMLRNPQLRAKLILEEALETVTALVGSDSAKDLAGDALTRLTRMSSTEPDIVEAIDGVCDLIVVGYGTAEDIGIDLEPFWDEVQRSNVAKAGGGVNEHGKHLKPVGWTPPDIRGVLDRVRSGR